MTLAYYVSSHGLGHWIRSAQVIKALPRDVPVLLRTDVARRHVEEALEGRAVDWRPAAFDCGAVGRDSLRIDPAATFAAAEAMQADNERRLGKELELLRSAGARAIAADAVPFAMRLGREAGLATTLVANFTWVEIYRGLIRDAREAGDEAVAARGEAIAETLRAELALGDRLLIPGMDVPMEACRERTRVGVIARRGRQRREELCRELRLDPGRPIYLLYLGLEGCEGMDAGRLAGMAEAQFFSFQPAPVDARGRVPILTGEGVGHADAVASADAVVGKLGYSLCAECLAQGKPILYPPRPGFAEAPALARAMGEAGLGIALTDERFRSMQWGAELEAARELARRARPVDCGGAREVASRLAAAWEAGGRA